MNLVSIETGKVSININGPITISNNIYDSLTFIGRLLSIEELFRLDRFLTNSIEAESILEESIFDLCVEDIVGFNEKYSQETIDKDAIEAGVITTVSYAILLKSQRYALGDKASMEEISASITVLDSMIMAVSRFSSTPYDEVKKLPINEVFRRFAIINKVFPGQVHIETDEE